MPTRDLWRVIALVIERQQRGDHPYGLWHSSCNPMMGEVEETVSGGMDWVRWNITGIMPNLKGWRDRHIRKHF